MLVFENKLNPTKLKGSVEAFKKKLFEICDYLQINPNFLMVVMYNESGLNPAAQNKISKATGLIQWMPFVLKKYNLTPEQMKNKSGVEQLDYVKKYFERHKGKLKNVYDVYLAVFYPYAINKPLDYIFGSERSINFAKLVYKQNSPLGDKAKGFVTRESFNKYIYNKYKKYIDLPPPTPPPNIKNNLLLIIGLIATTFLLRKFV